jgi:hypothetical protein
MSEKPVLRTASHVVDEEVFFENAAELFATTGWKDFIADVRNMAEACSLENTRDADEFWVNKGRLDVIRRILSYEHGVRTTEAVNKANNA